MGREELTLLSPSQFYEQQSINGYEKRDRNVYLKK